MSKRWVFASLFILILIFILLLGRDVIAEIWPSQTPEQAPISTATIPAAPFDTLDVTLKSFLAEATLQIDYSLLETVTASVTPNAEFTATARLDIANFATPDATLSTVYLELQKRWLSGQPCTLPCWEDLVPGETSLSLARNLLAGNTLISHESLEILVDSEASLTTLTWKLTGIERRGAALFSGLDEAAILLAMQLDLGPGLRLGSLVDAFGAPSHALLQETSEISGSTLNLFQTYLIVWREQGLVIHGVPVDGLNIDAQFEVTDIRLFNPGSEALFIIEGAAAEKLLPWHGYDLGSKYRAE